MSGKERAYFSKVFKGYDPDEVNAFLVKLNDEFAQKEQAWEQAKKELEDRLAAAEREIADLRARQAGASAPAALEEKRREYEALCADVGARMMQADKRAEEIIKNAGREASLVTLRATEEARADAKRLLDETRAGCAAIDAAVTAFRAQQDEIEQTLRRAEALVVDAVAALESSIGRSGSGGSAQKG